MFARRKYLLTVILIAVAAIIHLYSRDSIRVENGYSKGVFPFISSSLRWLFGWLPFSAGDIFYGLMVIFLVYRIIKTVGRKGKGWQWKRKLFSLLHAALIIYVIFNLLWGLNYNRAGILHQLKISANDYSKEDLVALNSFLLERVNDSKKQWIANGAEYPKKAEMFSMVNEAYSSASKRYPFLKYEPSSIKPSVWSIAGNFLGFTGYYNPFTGEAQVNTTTPAFLHPFTACHEVAHQVGYAKEMEANFVGFLAASHSKEPLLSYSLYLDLFFYANRNLFSLDSASANQFRKELILPVQQDVEEWRRFRLKHRSFLEPVFRWAYGAFLERNEQPQGILAYDEVTSFVIAFYKEEGILPK